MSFDPELCRNESEVESKLIVGYLLPKLGYSPDTWHQEVRFGKIRLDFLAFTQKLPLKLGVPSIGLIIEAKHPRKNLDKHVYQLRSYLTSLDISYGLLTNGKDLRIYHQTAGTVELVLRCATQDIDARLADIISLIGRDFTRKQFAQNSPTLSPPPQPVSLTISASSPLLDMKTIAIYHNKGGVGKTTVSTNLAAALSKRGYRVLLIDIDAQANSTFATGLVKFQFEEEDDLRDRNVCHLISSGDTNFIHEIVRESQYFSDPEIAVIPAHINLIDKQGELTTIMASRNRLIEKLKRVENNYDIVIFDTPPSRDIYAEVALLTADYLIIPSDLKPFANQGLPTVKKFITAMDETRSIIAKKPIQLLGVLASKISTNARFIEYTFPKQREVIGKRYEMPLMESVIYDRTALSESFNKTVIVGDLEYPDPKSIFKYANEVKSSAQVSAMEFEVLAQEVLTKIGLK
ncbi:AAA family ATPase [Chamaesiphon minutus]|uniref:ATPase involved in chromosome partitioning n=1 Tax=Chamaesiphon minutus (strain ATCC 27169 / PCC 6605) TaxID=1173020 RepID=K9U9A6_CHAP6|nr:AAA family ATPase [Chamaesiphon minutus]AFY91400.1 ATPase involved in chromosome partitioning [Chamaesiphon minutus PCC 6605]